MHLHLIWAVDIFPSQASNAQTISGCLLNDAIEGFPVRHYPRCLQKAHDNAALVDFDFDVLQDESFRGFRASLGAEAPALDIVRLRNADPGQRRYG